MNIIFFFLILICSESSFCMEGKSSKRSSLEAQARRIDMQELTQVVVEAQSDSSVGSPFVKTSYENSFTEESEDDFQSIDKLEFPFSQDRSKTLQNFRKKFIDCIKKPQWDSLYNYLMVEFDALYQDLKKQNKENVVSRDTDNSTYIFLNRKFAEIRTEMIEAVKDGIKEEYKNIESQNDQIKSRSNFNRNIVIACMLGATIVNLGGLAYLKFGPDIK